MPPISASDRDPLEGTWAGVESGPVEPVGPFATIPGLTRDRPPS